MLVELRNKDVDIAQIARQAGSDASILLELIDGLELKVSTRSGEETVRYNCVKALMVLAETRGELLYPHWDRLVRLLESENSYHKMSAVQLLARLVRPDTENRFGKVFDAYFDLLEDKSMIVAIYVAQNAARIVKARPSLEPRITDRLLQIEDGRQTLSRKALVIAGAIESFSEYVDTLSDRTPVLEFVARQQQSGSPKARKLAGKFLKKWGNTESVA